jgi:hypothetical protein
MKQRFFWLCVLSLVPAAVGCAHIDRLYDSQYFHESNPGENVAIVFCQPNLHIDMIDNHSMKGITNAAEVEPGRHEISVEYRRHDYGYYGEPDIYSKNRLRLALDALPGHIYEIKHDVPEQVIEATTKFGYLTSWNAWIQDVTSQPEAEKYLSYLK